jgi:hypothetical protein
LLNRYIAISFLVLFLLTSTDVEQFLKLPELLEHFKDHQKHSSNLSFIDFLRIHYIDSEEHGNTLDKDEKLPFKSIDDCHCFNVIALPIDVQLEKPVKGLQRNMACSYNDQFLTSAYLSFIWQPPKFS